MRLPRRPEMFFLRRISQNATCVQSKTCGSAARKVRRHLSQNCLKTVSEMLRIVSLCLTIGGGNAEFGRENVIVRRNNLKFARHVVFVSKSCAGRGKDTLA